MSSSVLKLLTFSLVCILFQRPKPPKSSVKMTWKEYQDALNMNPARYSAKLPKELVTPSYVEVNIPIVQEKTHHQTPNVATDAVSDVRPNDAHDMVIDTSVVDPCAAASSTQEQQPNDTMVGSASQSSNLVMKNAESVSNLNDTLAVGVVQEDGQGVDASSNGTVENADAQNDNEEANVWWSNRNVFAEEKHLKEDCRWDEISM